MITNYNYHCPHCKSKLNSDKNIQFKVKNKANLSAKLTLSALPGDFEFTPDFSMNNGESLLFFCPSCNSNLQSKTHQSFVEIYMCINKDRPYRVLFSTTSGEKMTFVILDEEEVKLKDNFYSILSSFNQAS